MENLQQKLEQDERDFNAIIQRLKNLQRFKAGLLQVDFIEFKKVSPLEYWQTFFNLYKGFCFFPDDEIKNKLRSLGLLDEDLIYFTPLDEILDELKKIWSDDNIIPVKSVVLQFIKQHYDTKISTTIVRRLGFTAKVNGKEDATILKKSLTNIKRRRIDNRKAGLKSFRSPIDEFMYQQLLVLDKLTHTPANNEDFMLAISDGNTKPFLKGIIESHHYVNMSTDSFLRKFYFLFRLIVKDGTYLPPDEKAFDDLKGYAGKSFLTFQTIKVKDIIYQKKSPELSSEL